MNGMKFAFIYRDIQFHIQIIILTKSEKIFYINNNNVLICISRFFFAYMFLVGHRNLPCVCLQIYLRLQIEYKQTNEKKKKTNKSNKEQPNNNKMRKDVQNRWTSCGLVYT